MVGKELTTFLGCLNWISMKKMLTKLLGFLEHSLKSFVFSYTFFRRSVWLHSWHFSYGPKSTWFDITLL